MKMRGIKRLLIVKFIILCSIQLSALPSIKLTTTNAAPYTELTPDSTYLRVSINPWDSLPSVRMINNKTQNYAAEVNRYRQMKNKLTHSWQNYTPEHNHTFSIKYRTPQYGEIQYTPQYLNKTYLPTVDPFKPYKRSPQQDSANFSRSMIDKINDSIAIYSPQYVTHEWDKIPSPHRIVMDGVLLDKKAAQEAFHIKELEAPRKLAKKKEEIKTWTYTGTEALQFSQGFFENWSSGGENSVSFLSDLRVNANYKRNKLEWDNKGIHKLGVISQEDQRTRINNDLIQLTSKLGLNASKKWFYSALYDFKTQFFYGRSSSDYDKILSGFMSPAYLTFAIGMDYKRDKNFTILVSPITSKMTMVLDTVHVDPSKYKIPDGKKIDKQTGASVTSNMLFKLAPEMTLTSNLEYFYSYLDDEAKSQLSWEFIFNMKLNKYLSTRFVPHFRYYQNESETLQFKENLTIAFNYTF